MSKIFDSIEVGEYTKGYVDGWFEAIDYFHSKNYKIIKMNNKGMKVKTKLGPHIQNRLLCGDCMKDPIHQAGCKPCKGTGYEIQNIFEDTELNIKATEYFYNWIKEQVIKTIEHNKQIDNE